MSRIAEQIEGYIEVVDRDAPPITVRDVLARIDSVRVSDIGARPELTSSRWRNLTIAAIVASAFLVLIGAPYVFGRWVDTASDVAGTTSPDTDGSPTDTTLPPPTGATMVTATDFGTWTWVRSEVPASVAMVHFENRFWWVDSRSPEDDEGEGATDFSSFENVLMTSVDGVSFESQALPPEMQGLAVSALMYNGELLIIGRASAITDDVRAWRWDAGDWVEASLRPFGPGDLPATGYSSEGFTASVWNNPPVASGEVEVAFGAVQFEPRIDMTSISSLSEEATNTRDRGIVAVSVGIYPDQNEYEIEYRRTGTRVDYTIWTGSKADGVLFDTASITAPDERSAVDIATSWILGPTANLFWRSVDGGATFELVPGPFDDVIDDSSVEWFGVHTVLARDGRFLAYGRIPGGPTTAFNESSPVGAVASSDDGTEWDVTPLPDLVQPQQVFEFGGSVFYASDPGLWISEDGISGRFVATPGENWGISHTDRFIMRQSATGMAITLDGLAWEDVRYPERGSDGVSTYSAGDVVVFTSPSNDHVWIGSLDR